MNDFEIAGCVKIYKKPRDTDSRGKYIPKHKRGPDVELFKGQRNFGTSPFIFLSLHSLWHRWDIYKW